MSKKEKNPRSQMVVQSNDYIRHSRNQLSAQEQDIVYFLISKVKPTDNDFMRINFTVEEICELCGIDSENGKNYKDIKKALKSVADKSAWVEYPNGIETLVRWVDTYVIQKGSGAMTAVLSQSIKPFLLGLIKTGFYTQAELINFISLKSKYSKRLYEILKSYIDVRAETRYRYVFHEFEVTELKQLVSAENYGRYKDFRVNVLDISMREINEFTDITASYTPIKPGRAITHVRFCIKLKKPEERFSAHSSAEAVLSIPEKNKPITPDSA